MAEYLHFRGAVAQAYAEWLSARLFEPFGCDLGSKVGKKEEVLELAAGSGAVTRFLPSSTLATDLYADMLVHNPFGRERVVMDAEVISLREASVDVVACGFGLMFMDLERAYPQIWRVLRPGGRLLATVWLPLEAQSFNRVANGWRPMFYKPFVYGDPAEIEADLRKAGFDPIRLTELVHEVSFDSCEDAARAFIGANAGMLNELGDEAETGIAELAAHFQQLGASPCVGTMRAWLIEAIRPTT